MKLFLTGGTGFLGSNIIRVAQEKYDADVFTTVNRWRSDVPVPFDYARVDISDRDAVLNAVRKQQPDAIVHSAILNDFPLMYRDRKLAWRLYVEATRHIVDAANEIGCKVVLVSTDWVFDGTQSGADETTPPNPVNYYGVLKVACERVVLERASDGAVARVAGVNGVHWMRPDEPQTQNAGYGHFITAVAAGLQKDGTFAVWNGDNINTRATPSLASDSAEQIMKIITGNHRGLFHCTGSEAVDRVALARTVAEVFGYDPAVVVPVTPPPDDGIPIPRDTSLSAQWTASRLGHTPLTVWDIVSIYKHQLETGNL